MQDVFTYFKNVKIITESDYDVIKNNWNRLIQIKDINTALLNDLNTSMDESTELIKNVKVAIDFTNHSDQVVDMYNLITKKVLPPLLPGVDLTLEQKQAFDK